MCFGGTSVLVMVLSLGSGAGVEAGSMNTNCVKLFNTAVSFTGHIMVTMGIDIGIAVSVFFRYRDHTDLNRYFSQHFYLVAKTVNYNR